MNTNVEALKNLYIQLGGEPADVQDCSTIVEVLNVISGKYEGETDAVTNPDAIDNIAAVAENIGGGATPHSEIQYMKVEFTNDIGVSFTVTHLDKNGQKKVTKVSNTESVACYYPKGDSSTYYALCCFTAQGSLPQLYFTLDTDVLYPPNIITGYKGDKNVQVFGLQSNYDELKYTVHLS